MVGDDTNAMGEENWAGRVQDNINWFNQCCDKYCSEARAIVIFGRTSLFAISLSSLNTYFFW